MTATEAYRSVRDFLLATRSDHDRAVRDFRWPDVGERFNWAVDWFDAIALPGGRLGIAIGDVAGRGLHAATTMGQLRHAMRAYAHDHDSPTAVLHRNDPERQ